MAAKSSPANGRQREIEQLGAALFVDMHRVLSGQKIPEAIAEDALAAARAYYAACDKNKE